MNNEKLEVIIDGANILHDDRGMVKKDDNGERILQTIPERLFAAISFFESKGWRVTAILKEMSYYIASKNKDSEYVGDMNLLDDMIKKKKVLLISKKKEDIYFITQAIEKNAYLITRDKFKEEREKYPNLDWDDIENRTLREHSFLGEDFVLPGFTERSADLPITVSYKDFRELIDRVDILENKILMIEDSQNTHKKALKDKLTEMEPEEIVLSVLDTALKGGKEITVDRFYQEAARAVLGNKKAKSDQVGKYMKAKLKYSNKGFLHWLLKLSNKTIKQRKNGGKVFIRYG